jgi:hypothetical protein
MAMLFLDQRGHQQRFSTHLGESLMRRIFQLSTLGILAGVASACNPDRVVATQSPSFASVRFINAVPDTGAAFGLDFRFVDIVENSDAFRITFRDTPSASGAVVAGAQIEYKPAQVGSRHFRIFLSDSLQSVATTVLKDSTVTLEQGHNYTFLLWGNARSTGSDKMRLTVVDENVADPGQQVALRVINASGAAIDARQYPATGTVPAGADWANVAAYTISTYKTVAPAPIKFNIQPAGGGTALFTDPQGIVGEAVGTTAPSSTGAGCTVGVDCNVIPGTTVPGSAVTVIVFPRSVAGSKATNFTTPGAVTMWDRRPATTCKVSFGC